MLDSPIGEEQLRANRTDFGPLSLLDHRPHPVSANYPRVVVQKQKKFASSLGCTEVVDGREIEWSRAAMNLYLGRNLLEVLQRLRLSTIVVQYDDFVVLVISVSMNALQTLSQQLAVVSGRNQNRYERLVANIVPHRIQTWTYGVDRSVLSASAHGFADGACAL